MRLVFTCLALLLVLATSSSAIVISTPTNETQYTNLVSFEVSWDAGTDTCKQSINRGVNHTMFSCDDTFIVDVPFHEGVANVTLFSLNTAGETLDSSHITFQVSDPQTTTKGLVAFGSLLFSMFIPLFLFLVSVMFVWLGRGRDENQRTFEVVGYALLLLSFAFSFVSFNTVNVLARKYLHEPIITDVLSVFPYNWVFIALLFITFTTIILSVFMLFSKKRQTGDYDYDES